MHGLTINVRQLNFYFCNYFVSYLILLIQLSDSTLWRWSSRNIYKKKCYLVGVVDAHIWCPKTKTKNSNRVERNCTAEQTKNPNRVERNRTAEQTKTAQITMVASRFRGPCSVHCMAQPYLNYQVRIIIIALLHDHACLLSVFPSSPLLRLSVLLVLLPPFIGSAGLWWTGSASGEWLMVRGGHHGLARRRGGQARPLEREAFGLLPVGHTSINSLTNLIILLYPQEFNWDLRSVDCRRNCWHRDQN